MRRCVWSRNIKNRCSIYIYIYDISNLRVKARHRKTASSTLKSHHCCWSYSYYSNMTMCLSDKNTTELCFYITGTHTKISCPVGPPVSARIRLDGFGWNLILEASTKICWETSNLVKNLTNIWGHFTGRPKAVYNADSSRKYFAAQEQCKGNSLLHFHGNNEHFFTVDSYI